MAIFGMVSTKSSRDYTSHAVASFYRETPRELITEFHLIDNDGSLDKSAFGAYPNLFFVTHERPKSFAENANQILRIADKQNADLYFLNNDLVFSNEWITPLLVDTAELLSPISNRESPYLKDLFRCERFMALEEYLGFESEYAAIVQHHQARNQGYRSVLSIPFFCIKIPRSVYTVLGELDETFGIGGAEDNDYCLRACLKAIPVKYALRSYILHFSGRSTWNGAESSEESRAREQIYLERFVQKWGAPLQKLIIEGNNSVIVSNPEVLEAAKGGNFQKIVQLLHEPASLSA